MSITIPAMPTIGEIARRLGVSPHRVEYLIRARGIQPCGWAGNARVFSEEAVQSIAFDLERLAKSRGRDHSPAQ
jgi:DNA-binding transcriptional MerR regulator